MIKTKKVASLIVGGLSKPSKMPGKSIGYPIEFCHTGSKLRKVPGSVCEGCYAGKGCYTMYKAVGIAQHRRYEALNHPQWVEAMVKLLQGETFFRWHDSGDLKDLEHLEKIVKVCELTPDCNHWLPTKEKSLVSKFIRKFSNFPDNLSVRVSMPMVDMAPIGAYNTSTVHTKNAYGYECPAYQQGGECRDCRACWNKSIPNVSYPQH